MYLCSFFHHYSFLINLTLNFGQFTVITELGLGCGLGSLERWMVHGLGGGRRTTFLHYETPSVLFQVRRVTLHLPFA